MNSFFNINLYTINLIISGQEVFLAQILGINLILPLISIFLIGFLVNISKIFIKKNLNNYQLQHKVAL
jgi:hypothetical protein